jgi:hypothetical protein
MKETQTMTRIVNINGSEIRIETGLSPAPIAFGSPKGELRTLLEQMRIGESVWLPLTAKEAKGISSTLTSAGRYMGCAFSFRTEPGGARIYCLPSREKAAAQTHKPTAMKAATKPNGLSLSARL